MKKVNPKKKPATQDDVNKALKKGVADGIRCCLLFVVYTIVDKGIMDEEQYDAFKNWYKETIECIRAGNLKIKDIEEILQDEYKWVVETTEDKYATDI